MLDGAERFAPSALATLRDAIEWREVRSATGRPRAAAFQMLATVRRCPCVMAVDFSSPCGVGPDCQAHHQWRAIKWFIDIVDLQVTRDPTHSSDWIGRYVDEPSATVLSRVTQAYQRQLDRGQLNAHLSDGAVKTVCVPEREYEILLDRAIETQSLSGRDCILTLKVARTLADLEGAETIRRVHLAEALICRFLRVQYI